MPIITVQCDSDTENPIGSGTIPAATETAVTNQAQMVIDFLVMPLCTNTITGVAVAASSDGDNCTADFADYQVTFDSDCNGLIISGSTIMIRANITTAAPPPTAPADDGATVECVGDIVVPMAPATLTDACGEMVVPAGPVVVNTPDPIMCAGTRTYTWTYTFCDGSTDDYVHTVTVTGDVTTDEVPASPAPVDVTCFFGATTVPMAPAAITDNCGNAVMLTGPVRNPVGAPACVSNGTVTYTWTYTYCNGTTMGTYVFTYNITDMAAPALTSPCPPLMADVPVGANCTATVPDVISGLTGLDNCTNGPVTFTQVPAAGTAMVIAADGCGPAGPAVGAPQAITITISDCAMNSATVCAGTVRTPIDDIDPTVSAPAAPIDVMVSFDGTTCIVGTTTIDAAFLLANGVTTADNCQTMPAPTLNVTPVTYGCDDIGTMPVINVTATDCNGNTSAPPTPVTLNIIKADNFIADWALAGGDFVVCPGTADFPVQIMLGPNTPTCGTWSGDVAVSTPAPFMIPEANFPDLDADGFADAGSYSLTYTVGQPGCHVEITHNIMVAPEFNNADAALIGDQTICLEATEVFALDGLLAAGSVPGGAWTVVAGPTGSLTGAIAGGAVQYQGGNGDITLQYTLSDCDGNDELDQITLTIEEKPAGDFTLASNMCQDGGPVVPNITGVPAGATIAFASNPLGFITDGTTGKFDPAAGDLAAEFVDVTVTMTVTNGTCPAHTISQIVRVYESGDPAFTLASPVCEDAAPVALTLTNPMNDGGANPLTDGSVTWTGTSVTDNGAGGSFDPSVGPGVYTVCVTVGAPSCEEQLCQDITVQPSYTAADVALIDDFDLCATQNATIIDFAGLLEATAVLSGSGTFSVTEGADLDGTVNPNSYQYEGGYGDLTVTYSLPNCADPNNPIQDVVVITIEDKPDVGALVLPGPMCATDAPVTIDYNSALNSTSIGGVDGVFDGPGITDNGDGFTAEFDPAAAGESPDNSEHLIFYEIISPTGICEDVTVAGVIQVDAASSPGFVLDPNPVCLGATVALALDNADASVLAGSPDGDAEVFWFGGDGTNVTVATNADGTGTAAVSATAVGGTYTICVATGDVGCAQTECHDLTVDVTAPMVDCGAPVRTKPADMGVCSFTMPGAGFDATFNDNCGVGTLVHNYPGAASPNTLAGSTFPVGSTTVTWEVLDAAGNISTFCGIEIIITDEQDPTIDCGAGAGAPANLLMNPSFEANGGFNTQGADSWGHFNAFVIDQNAGAFPAAQDGSVYMKTFGIGGLTQDIPAAEGDIFSGSAYVMNASFDGMVSDNHFGVVKVEFYDAGNGFISEVEGNKLFKADLPFDTWVQSTVQAIAPANTAYVKFVVVSVNPDPVPGAVMFDNAVLNIGPAGVSGNVTVSNDDGECGAELNINNPDADDNCGIVSIINDYNSTTSASDFYPVGTTVVGFTATDAAGNTAECTITVEVTDDEDPEFVNCPTTPVIVGNDVDECSGNLNWSIPVATDNCEIATVTQTAGPASGTAVPVGTAMDVTYTATDIHGNSSECTFTVQVLDTQNPAFDADVVMPADITVECDAVPTNCVFHGVGTPCELLDIDDVNDNCPGPLTLGYTEMSTQDPDPNVCGHYNYALTRTWTITDVADNVTTHVQVITVQDTQAPVPACVSPVTLTLDKFGMATLPTDQLLLGGPISGAQEVPAVVTDGAGTITGTLAGSTLSLNVEFAGLSSNVTAAHIHNAAAGSNGGVIVNLGDLGFPTGSTEGTFSDDIVLTASQLASLNAGELYVNIHTSNVPSGEVRGQINITVDNCAPFEVLDATASQTDFTCADLGDNLVTITVADPCLNDATCDITVKVVEGIAPCVPEATLATTCLNNATTLIDGEFAELITVKSLAMEMWEVSASSGLSGSTSLTMGTADGIDNDGDGSTDEADEMIYYTLEATFVEGVGYTAIVTNGTASISLSNNAYYPTPKFNNLPAEICPGTDPFLPEVEDVFAGLGAYVSAQFFIDGVAVTEIDASTLSLGAHELTVIVDGGDFTPTTYIDGVNVPGTAVDNAASRLDPGCIQSYSEFFSVVTTPTQVVCNDLIHVTLEQDCSSLIDPDMVLEGTYDCFDDYEVLITLPNGVPLSPANVVTGAHGGMTLNYSLLHPISGNLCWGTILVEDKTDPVVTCPANVDILCTSNPDSIVCWVPTSDPCYPARNYFGDLIPFNQCELYYGEPTAFDCSDWTWEYTDDYTPYDCATNPALIALIERTFVVTDEFGNQGTCIQTIRKFRGEVSDIDLPSDMNFACNDPILNTIAPDFHPQVLNDLFDWQCGGNTEGWPEIDETDLTTAGTGACGLGITYTDELVNICPNSYKVVRTWKIHDWCPADGSAPTVTTHVQYIKVENVAPVITVNCDFYQSGTGYCILNATEPGIGEHGLCSAIYVPFAQVDAVCDEIVEVTVETAAGFTTNGGYLPSPGLPLGGPYDIIYRAEDQCGNISEYVLTVVVEDKTAPTPICDEITDVNLSADGLAVVDASVFDDGSYDNCCVDRFEVRRMVDNCDIPSDLEFGPNVTFCCEDIDDSPIMVEFRVVDCNGNTNSCMVDVYVQDKLAPVLISCPQDTRILCDDYAATLETQLANATNDQEACDVLTAAGYGEATFYDNCSLNVNCNFTNNIDQCLEGFVRRRWTASDDSGNNSLQTCTQRVFVDHVSDWAVEFPADIIVECGTSVPDFGEPEIFFETCELVAVSYEDELFTTVPDACYKILRTWTVINWCVVGDDIDEEIVELSEAELWNAGITNLSDRDINADGFFSPNVNTQSGRTFRDSWNGVAGLLNKPGAANATQNTNPDTDIDSDPWDGYITYQQVIKVIDDVDPVFTNGCEIPDVCIEDNTCVAALTLPTPEIDECSDNITFNVTSDLGSGFGPFFNVAPGTYNVTYNVMDNCNNQTDCNTTVTVVDCKKPTPYCKNGVIVELMQTGMVDVWATDLDAGSFDNCPGLLKLSFSADVDDIGITFTCDDLGQNPVELWVTDAAGNQDYCETFVIIQDNMFACPGDDPLNAVAGLISTEEEEGVSDVDVQLSGTNQMSIMTDVAGMFNFNVETGGDYTVTPVKDDEPLNGVTTFDLVLLQKHILGVQTLDSPYKLIAADANNSTTVTTFDAVVIRKLILFIDTEFQNNTSWRFVDKDYNFPTATNPWAEIFPEVVSYNDISADELSTDFVAVKIGDLNGTAAVNLNSGSADDRSTNGTLRFNVDDVKLNEGQTYQVDFKAEDFNVLGYQFTLNFDRDVLEFVEVENAVAGAENFGFSLLEEGAITASWNEDNARIANGETVFSLVFTAKASAKLSNVLSVNSRYTKAEAYEPNGDLLDVELAFNGQSVAGFELYQNTPNPFRATTAIGFNLPEASSATLTITDVSGKLVKTVTGDYAKGYNQITLERREIPATGLLYYQLDTNNDSATLMMLLMD